MVSEESVWRGSVLKQTMSFSKLVTILQLYNRHPELRMEHDADSFPSGHRNLQVIETSLQT